MVINMAIYPKIETLFNRYPKGHPEQFKVNTNEIRRDEYLLFDKWFVTEKIDGMNIGIDFYYDEPSYEHDMLIHGRTERAQLPPDLLKMLQVTFAQEILEDVFLYKEKLPKNATIFMEAYGPGIQKGGYYRKDKSVRIFDILVDNVWLNWSSVRDIAAKLGVQTVPIVGVLMHTNTIVSMVKNGMISRVDENLDGEKHVAEGVIARTDPLLLDRAGRRVMWKLKTRDFTKQEML